MSTGTYPIVGVQDGLGPNGARPLRYEINKFVDPKYNPYARDQLNLFLLALEKIQSMPAEERLSWFQIGGIHGEPYVDWDNSKGIVDPSEDQWLGYCTHASILFPTWHRVYIVLIEQAVHGCMKQVLSEFPSAEQVALKPAVDHWRYPYWDWALVNPTTKLLDVPELMKLPTVTVQRPNGQTDTIDNPMYRYAFPMNAQGKINGINDAVDQSGQVVAPFSQTPYTVRHPLQFDPTESITSQKTWAQGVSNNDEVENALNNGLGEGARKRPGGRQLVGDVYRLFTLIRSYPPFSNTAWNEGGSVSGYHSLEGIHNNIHVFIGGMTHGHMSELEVAAFDPAFWMHHGNVERLLSIFQALNPADYKRWPNDKWISGTIEPWFTEQTDGNGTWTRPYGQEEKPTSPLTPFHTDENGTVYDSNGCRFIDGFGYAFEELQDWLPKYRTSSGELNEPVFCKDIIAALVEKYGWAVPQPRNVRRIALHADHDLPAADPHTLPLKERQYNEYVINVRVDRFSHQGQTFVVNFWLGGVPKRVRDWESADKLGVVAIFGGSRFVRGTCSNCASQAASEERRLVTGQLSITTSLIDLIISKEKIGDDSLKSLDKEEVGNFLKKHLHWRVSGLGHRELDINNIPSLKVSVAVATATLPVEEGEFVHYDEFEVLATPTAGRLSGFDPEKETF